MGFPDDFICKKTTARSCRKTTANSARRARLNLEQVVLGVRRGRSSDYKPARNGSGYGSEFRCLADLRHQREHDKEDHHCRSDQRRHRCTAYWAISSDKVTFSNHDLGTAEIADGSVTGIKLADGAAGTGATLPAGDFVGQLFSKQRLRLYVERHDLDAASACLRSRATQLDYVNTRFYLERHLNS